MTSNPPRNYIYRVAGVFDDDGNGVRGNLAAVQKYITKLERERNARIAGLG